MKYSVKYEVSVKPSNVIVEVVCKDEQDAKVTYEERLSSSDCLNVEIVKK